MYYKEKKVLILYLLLYLTENYDFKIQYITILEFHYRNFYATDFLRELKRKWISFIQDHQDSD